VFEVVEFIDDTYGTDYEHDFREIEQTEYSPPYVFSIDQPQLGTWTWSVDMDGEPPFITIRENVLLKGVLLGLPRKFVSSRSDEILDFAELRFFADQPIRTYSSGMLARLGFSIITQLQPKLLLIDEALAVGDVRFKEKCYGVIEGFKKKGVTILLVSHNPYEIRRLCDRAIWVDNHRIRDDGPVGRVLGGYMNTMKRCGPK